MRYTMFFLRENLGIPFGQITSTARKGYKWSVLHPGDELIMRVTESFEYVGRAIVTAVETVPFAKVISRAPENHAAFDTADPYAALEDGLRAAYGDIRPDEPFVMVFFMMINPDERDRAFDALHTERDYQDALRAASHNPRRKHSAEEFLVYMDAYLHQAKMHAAVDWSPNADKRTNELIRKVAALGAACLQENGAIPREMPDHNTLAMRVSDD